MDLYSVDEIYELLDDEGTESAQLLEVFKQHDLNTECQRMCDICNDFFEEGFEYYFTADSTVNKSDLVGSWRYISEAIVASSRCDFALRQKITTWVNQQQDAEWSRGINQAAAFNPNSSLEELLNAGKFTVDGFELFLVKNHQGLTRDIAAEILLERGWKQWPKDNLLLQSRYLDNEADVFSEIQDY